MTGVPSDYYNLNLSLRINLRPRCPIPPSLLVNLLLFICRPPPSWAAQEDALLTLQDSCRYKESSTSSGHRGGPKQLCSPSPLHLEHKHSEHNFVILSIEVLEFFLGNPRNSGQKAQAFLGKIPGIPAENPCDSGEISPEFLKKIPMINSCFFLAAGKTGASAPETPKKNCRVGTFVV